MSRTVYIDGRAVLLNDCHRIINSAVEELSARRSQVNCGHADVIRSHIDVTDAVKAFEAARYQDKMEVKDTNELQAKLTRDTPDYSVEALGDWKPDMSVPPIEVEEETPIDGRRLYKMLDVPALDDPDVGVTGVTMSVFEVDDGGGGVSYEIGLDSILYDQDGNWKSNKAKSVWEAWLAKRLDEEKESGGEAEKVEPSRAAAAMRVAGLDQRRKQRIPGGRTQTVYGTGAAPEVTTTMPAAQKFRVGE